MRSLLSCDLFKSVHFESFVPNLKILPQHVQKYFIHENGNGMINPMALCFWQHFIIEINWLHLCLQISRLFEELSIPIMGFLVILQCHFYLPSSFFWWIIIYNSYYAYHLCICISLRGYWHLISIYNAGKK